ncbi:MAG TPA: hypothetical protein VMB03_15080 [Bryobacteraceae bacterium]|nr:hypothetical protein [Bryobacteraceae bacterium]
MREYIVSALILFALPLSAQTVPAGWQIVKDSKNACQIAVPPDWTIYGDSRSAAVFHDASTALAVVTSQPGQAFAPLTEHLQTVLNISKGKLFENSAKRIFYQDKVSSRPDDPNWYTFSAPGKNGTCSGHLTFLPSTAEDLARKIVGSLGPVSEARGGTQ